MSKFDVGMRVVVIENNVVRKGVIKTLYESLEMSIVEFDDGNVEKVHFSRLGIESETNDQEEKTTESLEKSEITITPDEFREIASKACAKVGHKIGPKIILLSSIICTEIHKALFYNGGEND